TQAAAATVNAGSGFMLINNGGAAFTQGGTLTAGTVEIQNTAALSVGTITAGLVVLEPVGATTETGIITANFLAVNDTGGNAVLESANVVGTLAARLTAAGGAFSVDNGAKALTIGK